MIAIVAALLMLLLGGADPTGPTASATTAWRPLPRAGLERTEVGAARIGGSIYVVGGFLEPAGTTDAVERYEIERRRWRPGAACSTRSAAPTTTAS